ncbi:MAG: hypothetical protein Q7S97_07310 [Polaromonas sp.]|nr:hypothetical protein [Polaromonas sp.]
MNSPGGTVEANSRIVHLHAEARWRKTNHRGARHDHPQQLCLRQTPRQPGATSSREAAQPLRRSAAGQIEYWWATLGRVVEHSGLTVQEAQRAIERYEAAARQARPKAGKNEGQADALMAQLHGCRSGWYPLWKVGFAAI